MSTLAQPSVDVSEQQPELQAELPLDAQAGIAMSTARTRPTPSEFPGAPRLSVLGKRIEMLRVDRGLSKQALAKSSGTSRQQLWRVMTGKADLTGALGQRLATVLDVDSRTFSSARLANADIEVPLAGLAAWPTAPATIATYLDSPALVTRSLRSLPSGEDGVVLRTALLNAIEERTRARGLRIPEWLLQLRGSVLNGDF